MQRSYDYKFPNRIFRYLQRTGLYNNRNLFWSFYEPRNFGDWIGPYLFEAFTGRLPMHYAPKTGGNATATFAAGSILKDIKTPNAVTVWGSGIISEHDNFACPKEVLAVRGPRSHARLSELGYPTSETYGDPGILMPLVYAPDIPKAFKVGLIPHFVDHNVMRDAFSDTKDLSIIDVRLDVESVVDQILACEVTLSSSLHGVILSHSYGVPCVWIESWEKLTGDGVKFLDYFEAANVFAVAPQTLTRGAKISELEAMVNDAAHPDLRPLQGPLRAICPFG